MEKQYINMSIWGSCTSIELFDIGQKYCFENNKIACGGLHILPL